MDKIFKVVIILLLSGMLGLLVAIYLKIPNAPPTFGDLRTAKGEARRTLYTKLPLVYVDGSVDVKNTPLDVEVQNTPLDVDVQNTLLEVEISR